MTTRAIDTIKIPGSSGALTTLTGLDFMARDSEQAVQAVTVDIQYTGTENHIDTQSLHNYATDFVECDLNLYSIAHALYRLVEDALDTTRLILRVNSRECGCEGTIELGSLEDAAE